MSVDLLRDDFLQQEQYVLELPDCLADRARSDPKFTFDLRFDATGVSGLLQTGEGTQYPFRVFTLPLVTESYTSPDGVYYYKNADVGSLILVYEEGKIPQALVDYEIMQQVSLSTAAASGTPEVVDGVIPHGLTPPTAWAPFVHWPHPPARPRFFQRACDDDSQVFILSEDKSGRQSQSG